MSKKIEKPCPHEGASPVAYFWRGEGGAGDGAYLVFYCGECDRWFIEHGAHVKAEED